MSSSKNQPDFGLSDSYRLLAACFYQPERDLFLEEQLCDNLANLLEPFSKEASDACRRMAEDLAGQSQDQLLLSYSDLFMSPFGAKAYPYGSIYLDKEPLLMGDSTIEAQKFYDEAGLKTDIECPSDHIAIELEFMSLLEGRIAQAISESNQVDLADFSDIRDRFFNKLFASWAPILGNTLKEQATLAFYRDLGECLLGFINSEQQRLPKAVLHAP